MSKLIIERSSTSNGEGLSTEEEIRLRNDLGTFTINFIKVVYQTSFYRSEHKLAVKAVDEFLETLAPLKDYFFEITFMASSDESKPDIKIEGIFVEPIPLSTCMKTILRDDFIGKLVDFFNWNRLVSFSIKRDLDRDQFVDFLTIASREYALEKSERPREKEQRKLLSDLMIESGIVTVSAICKDEIVFADRPMPWRVKLAIPRLMKNMREIPLYARATKKNIQEAKALLFMEVIRPLRVGELLTELLLNCDLVSTKGTEMEGLDVEREVLAVFSRDQLCAVSTCLLREMEQDPPSRDDHEYKQARWQRSPLLFRKCMQPLSDILEEESMDVFRKAVEAGFISMHELPANVRQYLKIKQMANYFIEDPQKYLERIRAVKDMDSFHANASSSVLLFRELIRRKEYGWATEIVKILHDHVSAKSAMPVQVRQLAQMCLKAMAARKNLELVVSHLGELQSTDLDPVFRLCIFFRSRAIPLLVSKLQEDLIEETRAGIRAVLEKMGSEVLPPIRAAIGRKRQRWELYRDLLLVMGSQKDASDYQLAVQFLGAEEPDVRQAAFTAVFRTGGERAQRDLVRGLMDPDLLVRKTVVEHLAETGSHSKEFISFIRRLLTGEMRPGPAALARALVQRKLNQTRLAYLQLLGSGCSALFSLLKKESVRGESFEPYLVKLLKKQARFQIIKGNDDVVRERVNLLSRIITILRRIGTEASLPALEKARSHASQDIQLLAAHALRDIHKREGHTPKDKWIRRLLKRLKGTGRAS